MISPYPIPPHKKIVQFRVVVNDLMCWAWEDMPEVQPATLTGLIYYLRTTCGIAPEPLEPDNGFGDFSNPMNGHGPYTVRYGLRKQFRLPVRPTEEEFELMAHWHEVPKQVGCPVCGKPVQFGTRMQAGTMEEEHTAICMPCDLQFSRYKSIAMTPYEMGVALTKDKKNG